MSTTTAPYGARLHRAMSEHGPLCVGIDPHPGLLDDWGLTDSVTGVVCVWTVARTRVHPARNASSGPDDGKSGHGPSSIT